MSDSNNKKKAKWAEVSCEIHGKHMAGNTWKSKQVKVAVPINKKDRGCPECKRSK